MAVRGKPKLHKMNRGHCVRCGLHISKIESPDCGSKSKRKTISPNKRLKKLADDILSLRVRARDKWRCTKCHKPFNVPQYLTHHSNGNLIVWSDMKGDSHKLHASHYFNRANYNTRWNSSNVWAQCGSMYFARGRYVRTGCHAQCEGDGLGRQWFERYIVDHVGPGAFKQMSFDAGQPSYGHDYELIIVENYVCLVNLGYDMKWFKKANQKHMRINLERIPPAQNSGQ